MMTWVDNLHGIRWLPCDLMQQEWCHLIRFFASKAFILTMRPGGGRKTRGNLWTTRTRMGSDLVRKHVSCDIRKHSMVPPISIKLFERIDSFENAILIYAKEEHTFDVNQHSWYCYKTSANEHEDAWACPPVKCLVQLRVTRSTRFLARSHEKVRIDGHLL